MISPVLSQHLSRFYRSPENRSKLRFLWLGVANSRDNFYNGVTYIILQWKEDSMSTIEIRSLIDLAVNRLHELNLKQATIQTYWQRSFNFIIRRYEECHKTYYDQALMDEMLHQYAAQAEAGSILRKSYRWRQRGILMLREIAET